MAMGYCRLLKSESIFMWSYFTILLLTLAYNYRIKTPIDVSILAQTLCYVIL